MNLAQRIDLLVRLGEYMSGDTPEWQEVKQKAGLENGWFTPEFVEASIRSITQGYLNRDTLESFLKNYPFLQEKYPARRIGIVMAGNIPLVGFHDLLCVFLSGHQALIKASSKDRVMIEHLANKLLEWAPASETIPIRFQDMLKDCEAYIATGSTNTSRYFEYYFGKYPHIIRRNRSSVALLDGSESREELDLLSTDNHLYFGLGCRNVTKLMVPEEYDFVPLIEAFKKFNYLGEHHKYKNNYDYNLALLLLNGKNYMSSGSLLLVENPSIFSPLSVLHYEKYADKDKAVKDLEANPDLQCLVGHGFIPFGQAQCPTIRDFADGVDTLAFIGKTFHNYESLSK